MKKVYIIIPAFNEEKMIGKVIEDIKKEGFKNIIVVDDGSSDKTFSVAKKKGAIVIRHKLNLGQGAAIQTGFDLAKKLKVDIVVTFDADGQFEVKEIKNLIKPILKNECDVVLGSRFLGKTINMPLIKMIILKLGLIFTNLFSNISLTDTHNGFRVLNKKALDRIKITSDGMAHASDIIDQIYHKKIRYKEMPVTVKYTKYSMKKGQKITNFLNILLDLIFSKFS